MDVAYDHIQEEMAAAETAKQAVDSSHPQDNDLKTELTEAYQAISASPWGIKLGGFFGSVKKQVRYIAGLTQVLLLMIQQSETYYQGARQEFTTVSAEASKGLSGFLSQTHGLSLGQDNSIMRDVLTTTKPDSLPADIVKEGAAILSLLKNEATARLKQLEKAEDAADQAIAKIGVNVLGILKEAVTIAPPSTNANGRSNEVFFESKDAEGRRLVHATRLEAQLHLIHTTPSSFLGDPISDDYEHWKETFSVETKTGDITKDLAHHEDLCRAMEKLVPEQVEYSTFWARYYFLRHVIETQEQRRRELLKETKQTEEEEVAWDDEEEEEEEEEEVDNNEKTIALETIEAGEGETVPSQNTQGGAESAKDSKRDYLLKASEPRRSNEHSVADSEKSYDIVSGATSRAPGSPKDAERKATTKVAEESDEEDWE